MARKKKSKKFTFSQEDQLLWERRLRRRLDIENGVYNSKRRRIWENMTKKDKAEKKPNTIKDWKNAEDS